MKLIDVIVTAGPLALAACWGASAKSPAIGGKIARYAIDPDGSRIYLEDIGPRDAATVILAVGEGPGIDRTSIEQVAAITSRNVRIVLFDPRGVGRSSAARVQGIAQWGLAAQAADIERVRISSGANKVVLLGVSWGAVAAVHYVATYGKHVTSMVLVSPTAPTEMLRLDAVLAFDKRVSELVEKGTIPRTPDAHLNCSERTRLYWPAYFYDAQQASTSTPFTCSDAIVENMWKAVGMYDVLPDLHAVKVPVLIMSGLSDPYGPAPGCVILKELQRARASLVPLEGCGNRVLQECRDRFIRAVDQFLGLESFATKKQTDWGPQPPPICNGVSGESQTEKELLQLMQ